MAIHHSSPCGIGMATQNCRGWITQRGTDLTDQGLAIFGGDGEWGAQTGKNCAGADWFRHSCSLVFAHGSLTHSDI